ncbi:type I DNA topoisomerase [Caldisalinibacter kiritimatiensis]|uniref:DNA topoisomerase 1 n=1 Tax=Caldisalinibacter kiritimatiensis TaxID=1304284 RepID=R1CAG4_9FIRM|nr:type I DNA topoisomerase [Caldisalinibacter kiritimatiensis]EOC99314.1 DNA topoisomerase I [Caldisalinibacter kiritimatiensis]
MAKSLVIVESPAKAKTIGKFLGKNYKVKASVGHVRDLPKSKLGIDIENDFEPRYITIRGKGPVLKELKKEAKNVEKIYLATDPDREGEAISWHLAHILGLDESENFRIEFNEITKNAIKNAIKKPRKIDKDLVDAQQARRILDRLVGYKISPLLWRKVRKGLSAGRVQSVATKLICKREREIENFKPEEYWSLNVQLKKDKNKFEASFYGELNNGKEKKIKLKDKQSVDKIIKQIKKSEFIVDEVKKGTKKRNPYPPYTTSNLQQDANKRLGFSTKKTMMIAQQLYEGIDIKGEGTVGLITYIRTDSVRISKEAMKNVNDFIVESYGEEYSSGGRQFKKGKKDVQDAHEAIRPTSVLRHPEKIKDSLKKDQYKLYKLIWERFVASQMSPALYETLSLKTKAGNTIFKASGSKLAFDGFMKVYTIKNKEKDINIPNLSKGETVKLINTEPKQHFTQPPSRYTEASLVKTLEELGIGRPSTYAPTISTIINRGYVIIENKSLKPTELGFVVTDLLSEHFKDIISEEFTAYMESKLDEVETGDMEWKTIIRDFYDKFKVTLETAENNISKVELKEEETDVKCEKCGRNMVIKHGRYGKFLACPGYPECKNTKPLIKEIGVKCPECGGDIVERRSKKGRKFYGCSNYPKCKFVSWYKPINEKCPECGSLLVEKSNKKGKTIMCMNKECGFKKQKKE